MASLPYCPYKTGFGTEDWEYYQEVNEMYAKRAGRNQKPGGSFYTGTGLSFCSFAETDKRQNGPMQKLLYFGIFPGLIRNHLEFARGKKNY